MGASLSTITHEQPVNTGQNKTAHWHAGLVRKGCVGACGAAFPVERNQPGTARVCAACLEAQITNTVVMCVCT